jgi:hypothetical protein
MHASSSTTAFSLTMLIASLGHSATHDSQPVHFSLSTFAGIHKTLSKKINLPVEAEMLQNNDEITTVFLGKFTFR